MEIRGQIPTAGLDDGVVTVDDGVITSVTAASGGRASAGPAGDASGAVILPGLIDIHCHGGGGHVFTTSDPGEARAAAAHHAARGTTRVMASLVTAAAETLLAQVEALAPLVASGELLGIHLEGPFLSSARCGAQSPEFIIDPDPALAARLLEAADGAIRSVTLAPERPGAREVSRVFADAGVTVALGHTDASYEVMAAGLAELPGAGLVTHLANGMAPLHHRAAGPPAAALVAAAAGQASVELICDGVHTDAGFARLVFAAAAPGRVVLITDAMAAAGMPDGEYDLGPQRVRVSGGVARLAPSGPGAAGGAIAGGTSSLIEVVATARAAGIPLAAAAAAASASPARALRLPEGTGTLAPGTPADLVVADERLRPRRVLRGGRWLE
ncbi:MAG: amidohydrolase family protein [Actinomycetia bacterium]|nr:amidohydrolase family protein [Actinomycetes bacterium]